MNNEVHTLLHTIEKDEQTYGQSIFTQNARADDDQIKKFVRWSKKYIKAGFPAYIDFIHTINGLNYNGLFLCSLDETCDYNIYKTNETWWYDNDELKQYVFFGDDSISWYCLHQNTGLYCILDKPGGFIVSEYKTFDEIIIKALKASLSIDDD